MIVDLRRGCKESSCITRPDGLYGNTVKALSRGLELGADLSLTETLSLSANYTAMAAENRSPGDDFGHRLPRRANRMGTLEVNYTWPIKLTTSLARESVGACFYDNDMTILVKGNRLVALTCTLPPPAKQ